MSIYMQFAPYKLKSGDWSQQRDALRDTVIKTLAQYAPDFPSKILAAQTLTPKDLEDTYGLTGGHPFHGELSLDQIFTMRPLARLGALRHSRKRSLPLRQRHASRQRRHRRLRPQRRARNPQAPALNFL